MDPLSTGQLEVDSDPSVPLKPLPAPMEPEKLTSSKLMAVKSVLMEGGRPHNTASTLHSIIFNFTNLSVSYCNGTVETR